MTAIEPDEIITPDSGDSETPQPTYAPVAMALGIMMLLWGIVTMWIMSAAGAGLMAWSLCTWVDQIRNA